MTALERLDGYLHKGKWKKALGLADEILQNGTLAPSERTRYSFMSAGAYYYFRQIHPVEDYSFVRNHAEVIYVKAYALRELGEDAQAEQCIRRAVDLDPVSPKLKFELCRYAVRRNDFAAAESFLSLAEPCVMCLHDAARLCQYRALIASKKGAYVLSRLFCVYGMGFEPTDATQKQLDYVDSMLGCQTDPLDEQTQQEAQAALRQEGLDFHLSEPAQAALKELIQLYTLGGDEKRAAYYLRQLEGLQQN